MQARLKLAAVLLLVVFGSSVLGRWGDARPLTDGERHVVAGVNQVGLDLVSALAEEAPNDNHLLSPVSISAAWALLYCGSRGATSEELARTLHYPAPPATLGKDLAGLLQRLQATEFGGCSSRPRAELGIACGIFGTPGMFEPSFLEAVRQDYQLECEDSLASPAEAVARINAWAARATHGRIPNMLDPADVPEHDAAAMLVCAVYFKCYWLQEFPKTSTRKDSFLLEGGETTSIQMMHSKDGSEFQHLHRPDVQVLKMRYLSSHPYSMLVLLPASGTSLASFQRTLTLDKIESWHSQLKEEEVSVYFPSFTFKQSYNLQEPLSALGMTNVFKPEADFSGMTARRPHLLKSKHATWIEVNERGTEAAAVTTNNDFVVGGGSSVPIFRADHPFLFFIRDDETGSFLFAGRMMNPGAQGGPEPRRI